MAPLDDEIDGDGRPLDVPRPALVWQAAAAQHASSDHVQTDGVACGPMQLMQQLCNAAREVIRWMR